MALTVAAGITLTFDATAVRELAAAGDDDLARLELSPSGTTLSLRSLDVDIAVDGLLLDLLGAAGWKSAIRSQLNREAARITSAARGVASRENGKKGGRPPKDLGGLRG